MATELPESFASTEDMQAVIDKVYGDMSAEKAADAAALAADEAADAADTSTTQTTETTVTGDDASARNSAAASTVSKPATGEDQQATDGTPATGTETDSGPDWLDADLRDLATAIGIPEDKIGLFQSREELERTLSILDARAMEAGKQVVAGQQAQNPEVKKPLVPTAEPVKPAAPTGAVSQSAWDSSKYVMGDEFDDGVVKPHNEFVQAVDARIAMLEAKVAQAEQHVTQQVVNGKIQEFDSIIDGLGHTELFGTRGQRTPEQIQNVGKVWEDHRTRQLGLQAQGKPDRNDRPFVSRAVQAVFGEHLTKFAKQQVTQGLKAQSRRIMGGPAGKPVHAASNGKATPKENPAVMSELLAEFKRLEAEG